MTDEQDRIGAGRRIAALLDDDAVKGAFSKLDEKYYAEFKNAQTEEGRLTAWAQARVLDDLRVELRAIVDSGTRAAADRERRERTEAAKQAAAARRKPRRRK